MEYFSKQFDKSQKKLYIREKEILSFKTALLKWRCYLLGRHFVWRTDHAALRWANRVKSSKVKLAAWLSEISEFNYDIEIMKSTQMHISDCLSRLPKEINALNILRRDIKTAQMDDEIIGQIRNYVANDRWPNQPTTEIGFYKANRNNLTFGPDGELFLRTAKTRLVLPNGLITEVLESYHDRVGHPGGRNTLEDIKNQYVWYNMDETITHYAKSCYKCQSGKPNLKPRRPNLGLSDTPSRPFEKIAFDLVGPLRETLKGNIYICISTDLFSKNVRAEPMQMKTAQETCRAAKLILFSNPSLPKKVLTDIGTEFMGEFKELLVTACIKHDRSSPYNPQANGQTERTNQTVKNKLSSELEEGNWDDRLYEIVHAINRTKNATTKQAPFTIEYGYNGNNPNDKITELKDPVKSLEELQDNVRKRIEDEKRVRTAKYSNEDFVPFNIGDLVLAKNMVKKYPRFTGPYEVIASYAEGLSYKLKELDNDSKLVRRVEHLKTYYPRISNGQSADPQSQETMPPDKPSQIDNSDRQELEDWENLTFPIEPGSTSHSSTLGTDSLTSDQEDLTDTETKDVSQSASDSSVIQQDEATNRLKSGNVPEDAIQYKTPRNKPRHETLLNIEDEPITPNTDIESVETIANNLVPTKAEVCSVLLTDLTVLDLDAIITSYKLPIALTGQGREPYIKKAEKIERIKKHILTKFPNHSCDANGDLLFKMEIINK